MSTDYTVPADTIVTETEVRKSRFITHIAPAACREEAMTFIQSVRRQYPDASHHCTAFIAGPPEGHTAIAFDDDGEPAGTAGRAMLNVLMHKGIGEIVAVVVRYFGGIRLGAGGLVRAYGSAVQTACEQLPLARRQPLREAVLCCDYAHEQLVRYHMERQQIQLVACHYGEQVRITLTAPQAQGQLFARQLLEASSGQIQVQWQD